MNKPRTPLLLTCTAVCFLTILALVHIYPSTQDVIADTSTQNGTFSFLEKGQVSKDEFKRAVLTMAGLARLEDRIASVEIRRVIPGDYWIGDTHSGDEYAHIGIDYISYAVQPDRVDQEVAQWQVDPARDQAYGADIEDFYGKKSSKPDWWPQKDEASFVVGLRKKIAYTMTPVLEQVLVDRAKGRFYIFYSWGGQQ